VTEVRQGGIAPDPRAGPHQIQHLVELSSVDDDGLGDELAVVWEVESDARVLDKETLPTPASARFDAPERLDAFLDALRWGAVTSADSQALQSPFRAGITIEDYQLDPVVRALSMPKVNLAIFDDVGLGKTVEAGLVIDELLLRHRARTVLIVCPASLCLKWQGEMAEKFGLDFRIVDAELVRRLRRERGLAANPWKHFPRLIVSLQWLRAPRAMSLFREVLPTKVTYPRAFDMLVIDEVHNVAPSGRGRYATDSQQTKAIRELAPHFEHHVFLSATPHNGYPESWQATMEILDPQRFARGVPPAPAALQRVMVRRLKSELREELRKPDGSPRFAERRIVDLEVAYMDDERRVHGLIGRYRDLRVSGANRSPRRRQAAEWVTLLLKKRFFSSPAAFAETLAVHLATLAEQAGADSDEGSLDAAFDLVDEDTADDDELAATTAEALAAAAAATGGLSAEEQGLVDQMVAWAEERRYQPDAKAARLIAFLDETCRPPGPGGSRSWNDERVIIFTEYRDTQLYLYQLLADHLPEGEVADRVALIYGGMDTKDRERVRTEFQAHPSRRPIRIVIATDAASEGADWQLHCHRLVHIETPFNPSKMEQRNGRVDRHLQPSPHVLIHHFIGAGWQTAPAGSIEADLDFLARVVRKLDAAREDLGNVGPLLAEQVTKAMLGDRSASTEVTPSPKRKAAAAVLKVERDLRAEVARLAARIDETRTELGLTPPAVERVVRVGLELGRQAPLAPVKLDRPPGDPRGPSGPAYTVGPLTGSWARTVLDLPDPLDRAVVRPVTFDHALACGGADDVVLAHLGHPLVAQSMRLLRSRIWAGTGAGDLSRVTARLVDDAHLGELVVAVHARLVVTGRGGHRLHEEVIAAGGRLAAGRFSREGYGVGELARVLAAASDEAAPPHVREALTGAWEAIVDQLLAALRARAADRHQSLARRLAERVNADVAAMRAGLRELSASINAELDRLEEPEQLTFGFDPAERAQFALDVDSLRSRLANIPNEADAEEQAIRGRFEDQAVRLFPAAVTFLVPRRLAHSGIGAAVGATS
jgi:superfamily II DNA or RNA helicase